MLKFLSVLLSFFLLFSVNAICSPGRSPVQIDIINKDVIGSAPQVLVDIYITTEVDLDETEILVDFAENIKGEEGSVLFRESLKSLKNGESVYRTIPFVVDEIGDYKIMVDVIPKNYDQKFYRKRSMAWIQKGSDATFVRNYAEYISNENEKIRSITYQSNSIHIDNRYSSGIIVPPDYQLPDILRANLSDDSEIAGGSQIDELDENITITGRILYYNEHTNSWQPAKNITVTIWDEDLLSDDLLATVGTGITGYFSASVNQYNDPNGGRSDIYVKWHVSNQVWKVVDPSSYIPYFWYTPTVDNITGSSYDFGDRCTSTGTNASEVVAHEAMGIFQTIEKGWQKFGSNGHTLNEMVQCIYPAFGTYFSDPNIYVEAVYCESEDVILHEYGHAAMFEAYSGYWPPDSGGSHEFNLAYNTNLAWTEGFASAFALAVNPDGYFDWYPGASYCLETISGTCAPGDECEARVAASLIDIHDNNVDGVDTYYAGFNEIWDIVWDVNIDEMYEFWNVWSARNYNTHNVIQILDQNTIDYNTSPLLSGLPNQTLIVGSALPNAFDLDNYASDEESSDANLEFTIVGNTNTNCGVSIDINNYVDIFPAINWIGYSYVTIQASDGIDTATDIFRITVEPPESCPYVYTWGGSDWIQDNNILPYSQFSEETYDVNDWYFLTKPLKTKDGYYKLQLREFENEHSFFDNVKLVAIDHDPDVTIGVTNDGKILASRTLATPKTSSRTTSQYSEIRGNYGDETIVQFELKEGGASLALYTSGTPVPDSETGINAPPPPDPKMANLLIEPIEIGGGVIDAVGMRENYYKSATFIPPVESKSGNLSVRLEWLNTFDLESVSIGVIDSSLYDLRELELVKVKKNNEFDDLKHSMLEVDESYLELKPGDIIELAFTDHHLDEGKIRDFILFTTGRYETISSDNKQILSVNNIPHQYELSQCYPNPFNNTITVRYQTPEPAYIKIEVYSITGRKVDTLVNKNIEPGYHKISWQAENFASGTYIVRMNSRGFSQSKKILLLR